VERKGAASGLLVGLGTAEAMRARFAGRPASPQPISQTQQASAKKTRTKKRLGRFINYLRSLHGSDPELVLFDPFEKPRPSARNTPRGQTGAPVAASVDREKPFVKVGI